MPPPRLTSATARSKACFALWPYFAASPVRGRTAPMVMSAASGFVHAVGTVAKNVLSTAVQIDCRKEGDCIVPLVLTDDTRRNTPRETSQLGIWNLVRRLPSSQYLSTVTLSMF